MKHEELTNSYLSPALSMFSVTSVVNSRSYLAPPEIMNTSSLVPIKIEHASEKLLHIFQSGSGFEVFRKAHADGVACDIQGDVISAPNLNRLVIDF